MERQFTRQAENALKLATTIAKSCGHGYIGTEHLLAGLLKEPEGTAGKVLQEFNVEEEKLRELISSLVTPVQGNTAVAETKDPQYSPRARRIIEQAKEDAESMECLCGTEHLLLSLLKETDCVATRLLFTMGVNIQKLFVAILTAMGFDNDTIAEEFQYARNAGNKKVTSTPTLDQYSRDLTQLAAEGKLDPVIGRDKEITRLIQILSRRTKNNPCLTGEPGVGKTAIVEGLAQRIVMGMVPDTVKDKRLVVLDLSGMVAGSKYRGEFEERIKNVIQEVKEHQGILLFIDEIHRLSRAVEEILYPALEDHAIDIIMGKGPSARSLRVDLNPFTLVGATTRAGQLSSPLRDRFGVILRLELYTTEQLTDIVRRSAMLLKIPCSIDGAMEIAGRARGTPRIANRLLKRVRDFADVMGDGEITQEIAHMALDRLEIDELGLDSNDRRMLEMIIKGYSGGPVGLETLASALGEETVTLEDVCEPYLMQLGFLARTPRGRCATALAYQHLGYQQPDSGGGMDGQMKFSTEES